MRPIPRTLRYWLLLWVLAWALAGTAAARELALTATVTVENRSDTPISPYVHRLTIPADVPPRQELLSIDYPYDDPFTIKTHKNGVDRYAEFRWTVPAGRTESRAITFHLRLAPYRAEEVPATEEPGPRYLQPSHLVESDDSAFAPVAAAIRRNFTETESQLRAAFLYPQWTLDYERQPNRGALFALRNRSGDCTEYAALFVALARQLGVPARMTAEFLFPGERREFDLPNHQAAEVYLNDRWLPVDPNLATEPDYGYGFGYGGTDKILLKRGESWTWSNWMPGTAPPREQRGVDIRWSLAPAAQ